METRTVTTANPVVRHATYPGNVTHIVGEVKGPNQLREFLVAGEATYDPTTDTTRVGFAYATREDVARHREAIAEERGTR